MAPPINQKLFSFFVGFFAGAFIFVARELMPSSSAEKEDKISELPLDIIYKIFDRLRTPEAARTAILSRKWRYIWASYPQLVFDANFSEEFNMKHKHDIQYEFPKAINNALLRHSGPILKFVLHIPSTPHDLSHEIDQWMSFLSRSGIKELELNCLNPKPYIVPSCIFSCPSLLDLTLQNCIVKPPHEYEGFRHLVSLQMLQVSFVSASKTLVHNTSLKKLRVVSSTGIGYRSIYAPKIEYFSMMNSGQVDWQWFASNKQLKYVGIFLGKKVENVDQSMNIMKFLKDIPRAEMLYLDGFSLKYLATSNSHKVYQHRHQIHSLITNIVICNIIVEDVDQISSLLCLLKNCHNLKILNLVIPGTSNRDVPESVRESLDPSNCMDLSLEMLKVVTIKHMKGFKAELLLLKLLLVRSKSLQRMIIQRRIDNGARDSATVLRELSAFPRASLRSEIIYMDPPDFGSYCRQYRRAPS